MDKQIKKKQEYIKQLKNMSKEELNYYIDYELDIEEIRYILIKLAEYEIKELTKEVAEYE